MRDKHVDYDAIAAIYHRRYTAARMQGIADALVSLAQALGAQQILEVGCGTGRWLAELTPVGRRVHGLDLSLAMLSEARRLAANCPLVCGRASHLPLASNSFDLVVCVNALHHFDHPDHFVSEARRLLRTGGAFSVVGMDPRAGRDDWYLYHYFEGTRQTDLDRYPSSGAVVDWMSRAGFGEAEWRAVERIEHNFVGREVMTDPFLAKDSTSQLALLSDAAYSAGLGQIHAAVEEAEAAGREALFPVKISLVMVTGLV